MTTTAQKLYLQIYPHALGAFAEKSSDAESAKQMARAVAAETVAKCAALGIIEGGVAAPSPGPAGIGVPGIPAFAGLARPEGQGAAPIAPVGAPQQPALHYNHVSSPSSLPGQGQPPLFSAQGAKFEPSQAQAGVMGSVTQAPNPTGYNALGTNGVIQQPEQRPSGKDVIVAPDNQPMHPAVGGNGTTFVPEKIVR